MNRATLALLQLRDAALLEFQCNDTSKPNLFGMARTGATTGIYWVDQFREELNKKALTNFLNS